jgi:hypothetical protein
MEIRLLRFFCLIIIFLHLLQSESGAQVAYSQDIDYKTTRLYIKVDKVSPQNALEGLRKAISELNGVKTCFSSYKRCEMLIIIDDSKINALESQLRNIFNEHKIVPLKKIYLQPQSMQHKMLKKNQASADIAADTILRLYGITEKLNWLKIQNPREEDKILNLNDAYNKLNR